MTTTKLKAEKRVTLGRKNKNLRAANLLPGNVYGKHIDSVSVQVKKDDFLNTYKKVHETGIVELEIGEERRPVLITNTQIDPLYGEVLHVDFFQVNLKEKVKAAIPLEIIGESPAQKSGIGTVVIQMSEVEVEALPTDLPENFVVDITTLADVDQAVFVKDLKYDKDKIEITSDLEQIIVKVEPPQKEEVVEVAPVETTTDEAATPTEGEASETKEESSES